MGSIFGGYIWHMYVMDTCYMGIIGVFSVCTDVANYRPQNGAHFGVVRGYLPRVQILGGEMGSGLGRMDVDPEPDPRGEMYWFGA